MSDDRLTPREHAEMRDILLAGTHRIKPAGAHRMQLIAASVALVLVAGVTGAAIATGALLGSQPIPPAVTQTPSPSPSASETPAPEPPSTGVAPFGGECENVLTDAEVTAAWRGPIALSDFSFDTGAYRVLGGIDCQWFSTDEYLAAIVTAIAYPLDAVPSETRQGVVEGCAPGISADSEVCTAVGIVDGMWLTVNSSSAPGEFSKPAVDALLSSMESRLSAHPLGVAAVPTDDWWGPLDCAALVASIDPTVYGYARVEATSDSTATERWATPTWIPFEREVESYCGVRFSTDDRSDSEEVFITTVSGGAVSFDSALASPYARAASVDGASQATWVPGLDRYEGSWDVLASTDGTNVLIISPSRTDGLEGEYVPRLASGVLGFLG